ncbi:hypothetical protein HYH03_006336 [Edaphochlamys debaryana]|uniref:Uncharacterized protein n=1 Tax=Edaphochlamys debaryana TaxID=47281 RepID=A0A835Y4D8_9CHLO|nr:hypothetical protein HYH03_006336 [Edaphochlamys debaryana]|eukprot:KAG2495738.1 hypothetical protein HYH03_006336 [Edaphochlamys debaryana]
MAWSAHFDSSTSRGERSICGLLPGCMRAPDLYLAGSFDEGSGESEATLATVLTRLSASPLRFRVRLACVGPVNTAPGGGPRVMHLAVRCRVAAPGKVPEGQEGVVKGGQHGHGEEEEGEGQEEAVVASPAGFEDRGPELPRRFAHGHLEDRGGAAWDSNEDDDDKEESEEASAEEEDQDEDRGEDEGAKANASRRRAHAAAGSSGAHGGGGQACGGGGPLRWVVHTPTGRLRISGLRCRPPNPYVLQHYVRQLQLQDDDFLQHNSTSPDYEPANFVGDIKNAYRYSLEQWARSTRVIPEAWFEWAGDGEGAGWQPAERLPVRVKEEARTGVKAGQEASGGASGEATARVVGPRAGGGVMGNGGAEREAAEGRGEVEADGEAEGGVVRAEVRTGAEGAQEEAQEEGSKPGKKARPTVLVSVGASS